MAELPTDDDKRRMALDVFKHFRTRPNEGVLLNNVIAICAKNNWRVDDVAEGLKLGENLGWFRSGANGFIILTESGFREV